jgi:hypothetical protein
MAEATNQAPSPTPAPPDPKKYPKWLFHKSHPSKIVKTVEEHDVAEREDWVEHPDLVDVPAQKRADAAAAKTAADAAAKTADDKKTK